MTHTQYKTEVVTPRIEDVVRSLNKKEWDVHPDFQRPYVWKRPQQRRLIESILLGYTLPTFFAFDKFVENHEIVIDDKGNTDKVDLHVTYFSDGQQRLETLRRFMNNEFTFMASDDIPPFAEHAFDHLNGKKYKDFPHVYKQRICQAVIKIEKWGENVPEEVIQDHYDRINTGGKPLTYGHIRRNRYKGYHYDFLADLAMNKTFLSVLGPKSNSDNILKLEHEMQLWIYCANLWNKTFDYNTIVKVEAEKDSSKFGNYDGNPISPKGGVVENYLKYFKEHPEESTSEYREELKTKLSHATTLLDKVFGCKAFCKPVIEDGVWKTDKNGERKFGTFNLGIYEILMYLFTFADANTVLGREKEIAGAYYEGIRKNAKLQTALWYATTSIESTRTRFFNIYQIFVDAGVKFNW